MIVLKTSVDKRSGQLVQRVKLANGQRVRFFGGLSATALKMKALGDIAIQTIKDRASRSIGSDDQLMKPLNRRYAISKTKRGLGNKRNLTVTGDMLRNITVRSVSQRQVRIDITSQKERIKAAANEKRSPWFGWSPRDLIEITAAAERLFKQDITGIGIGARGGRGMARLDIPSSSWAGTGRLAA